MSSESGIAGLPVEEELLMLDKAARRQERRHSMALIGLRAAVEKVFDVAVSQRKKLSIFKCE